MRHDYISQRASRSTLQTAKPTDERLARDFAHETSAVAVAQGMMCYAGAFMSPDGQKALIAGGLTIFGCQHFKMKCCPQDYPLVPLPDIFELDLNTTCWVQAGSSQPYASVCSIAQWALQRPACSASTITLSMRSRADCTEWHNCSICALPG